MTILLASLPLRLLCQLIVLAAGLNNTNVAVNHSQPQVQSASLPDSYIASGSITALANLPLHLVCQFLVTSNPAVTENGTLVSDEVETPVESPSVTIHGNKTYPEVPVEGETTTETPPLTLPKGYVTFPEDNAAYKIHEKFATWNQARERCISDGGRLAIIDSREKIVHINSLKNSIVSWLHVGIRKSVDTGEWVRVDNGLPVESVPWRSSYPDGPGNCTGISVSKVGLVNQSCDNLLQFYVCEIPIKDD